MAGNGSGRSGSSRTKGGVVAPPKVSKGPQKVDYNGAMRIASDQNRAARALRANQYSFNGNGSWAMQRDRYYARSTTEGLARRAIKTALGNYRTAQAYSRFPNSNQAATPESAARYRASLPANRQAVVNAVRVARAFRPAYIGELRTRWDARQVRNATRRSGR